MIYVNLHGFLWIYVDFQKCVKAAHEVKAVTIELIGTQMLSRDHLKHLFLIVQASTESDR